MTDAPEVRISVVVVSFGRARALARCLKALHLLRYPAFEVIVVADADGTDVAATLPFADRLRFVPQHDANISAARNDGIAAAAGDLIAFIDDDAVPEPLWLQAIATGFQDTEISAVTGPVLGRNGISLQWGRVAIDMLGRDHPLGPDLNVPEGMALKLHGTNMAFRRSVFDTVGGFDRAYHFYMDDTDLALRVGQSGAGTRYLELATVHHGFAASARRTADRVPISLEDIGASTRVFLRKHAAEDHHRAALLQLEEDQRARLLRLARRRKLSTRRMRLLVESLDHGLGLGADRPVGDTAIQPIAVPSPFQPLRPDPVPPMKVLSGWSLQGRKLRAAAAEMVAKGQPLTLYLFEPTPRKHKVRFTEGGWWEQTGGLYGPSVRSGRRVQAWRLLARVAAERQRVARLRGFPD